MRSIL